MSGIKKALEELLESEAPRLEAQIAELEMQLHNARRSYEGQVRNTLAFKAENEKLRAELGKAIEQRAAAWNESGHFREALKSIAANTCCDKCREAALVARKALEEQPDD